MYDLCSLDDVRDYLGHKDAGVISANATLARLITSASTWLSGQVAQSVVRRTYVDTLSGDGTMSIRLRNTPVLSVQSLVVDGNTVNAVTSTADGWILQDDWLWLSGPTGTGGSMPWGPFGPYVSPTRLTALRFTVGNANVIVSYTAGYEVRDEPGTIPAAAPYQIQSAQFSTQDLGVKFSVGGAALTLVTGTPVAGQYAIGDAGLYTFAAADSGKGVLLSYGTVPGDIRQAAVELAAESYQRRERLGVMSKSIAGESVTFQTLSLAQSIKGVIEAYRSPRL